MADLGTTSQSEADLATGSQSEAVVSMVFI